MWRVVLLFLTVVLVGCFAGWAIRRFTARYSEPLPSVVASVPVAAAPAETVSVPESPPPVMRSLLVDGKEEEKPYVVGVSMGRGRLVVAWSDGTRQGEDDFAMGRQQVRVTRAAVWIDGERFPIKGRQIVASASISASVAAVPVSTVADKASASAQFVDDDPVWGYSQASRSWYLRDRSAVPGG